jgi:hypothetical protein
MVHNTGLEEPVTEAAARCGDPAALAVRRGPFRDDDLAAATQAEARSAVLDLDLDASGDPQRLLLGREQLVVVPYVGTDTLVACDETRRECAPCAPVDIEDVA